MNKRRFIMKLSAYVSLATAAVLAFVYSMGMCEGNAAAAVLALAFEAVGLACLLISGRD